MTAAELAGRDVETIRRAIAEEDDPYVLELLEEALAVEEERLDQLYAGLARDNEDDWETWLPYLFPASFRFPFADHHRDFWSWVWALRLGVMPSPQAQVDIWARGAAKSTSCETAVAAAAARRTRKVALYVCDKQSQADDHVANIATLLEGRRVEIAYPEVGERLLSKFGTSEGWRRNRLRTASGFTVNALGLDVAARGFKIDDDRPDLIVFDDLDDERDGPSITERKLERITQKLLPAGDGASLAVLAVQNVPNPHGIFARLAGLSPEPADFLRDRIVVGPIPAIADATFEEDPELGWRIVAGTATWAGQSIELANSQIGLWGITAFRREAQHDVGAVSGSMFSDVRFRHVSRADLPDLLRKVCWVDPAVTETDRSDSHAICLDGIATDGTIYRLRAWERRAAPVESLSLAIVWAAIEGCQTVGIETDQGGDTWDSVYREARAKVVEDLETTLAGGIVSGPAEYLAALAELAALDQADHPLPAEWHEEEKASRTQLSKASRAQQMLADYERPGRIVHVLGDHLILERALSRFGRIKPFDLTDAAYWSWRDLRQTGEATLSVATMTLPRSPIRRR